MPKLYFELQQAKEAFAALAKKAAEFAADCKHDSDVVAAERAKAYRQAELVQLQQNLAPHYDAVANAVGSCLQSSYQKVGLVRPHQIEDVLCGDNRIAIDGDYNNVTFRYEADRRITDNMYSGGKREDYPPVPARQIENALNSELRKYTYRRGYDFRTLSVDDIADNKVRISLHGVQQICPPVWPQMPFGSYQ